MGHLVAFRNFGYYTHSLTQKSLGSLQFLVVDISMKAIGSCFYVTDIFLGATEGIQKLTSFPLEHRTSVIVSLYISEFSSSSPA